MKFLIFFRSYREVRMDETNILCDAVVAWVSAVLPRLGPDQFQIIEAMLAGRCDVAVEARLLKGSHSRGHW